MLWKYFFKVFLIKNILKYFLYLKKIKLTWVSHNLILELEINPGSSI